MAVKIKVEKKLFLYLFNSRKFAVIAGVLAAVSVLLLLAVIIPQTSKSVSLYQQQQASQELLTKLQQKVAALDQVQTEQAFIQRDDINRALPSKKPLLEFINSLDLTAQETNVTVTEVSLNPGRISTQSANLVAGSADRVRNQGGLATRSAPAQGETEAMDVAVVINGTLSEINRFLREIENIAPISNVTNISLSEESVSITVGEEEAAEAVDTGLRFSADLTITTYFSTPSITAVADAPLPSLNARGQEALADLSDFTYPDFSPDQRVRVTNVVDLFELAIEEQDSETSN